MQKGITPIITTILLVLVTISIIGFALMFFTRSQQTAGEQAEKQALQQGAQFGTKFRIDNAYQNRVYIRNLGTTPISLSSLAFYVDNQPVEATGPETLQGNSVGEYVLDISAFPSGPAELRVSGAGSGVTKPICFNCYDFSLSNSGSIELIRGSSGSNTITATAPFTGESPSVVSFSCSDLPSDSSCSFNPGSCNPTCSSTSTISTSPATPLGTYTVTATGTGGNITRTTLFILTVGTVAPSFDFSLSLSPTSGSAAQGSSASTTATATLTAGTAQPVSFSCSGLPAGASCSFSPSSGNPTFSSTLTISTSSATPTGTYPITITATGGGRTRTSTYSLTVSTQPPVAFSCDFYVSPTGTTGGNGNQGSPWDLQTALNHPSSVKPGDTICLRGGTYIGAFISRLQGTSTAPIIVRQYPGERATIDDVGTDFQTMNAAKLTVLGDYTWFWGFEVKSSNTERVSSQTGSFPTDIPNGAGLRLYVLGTKFINLVVHDNTGVGYWRNIEDVDSEIYGNLIYNNGWSGPDRGHGHGIYGGKANVLTSLPRRTIDNLVFQNTGQGVTSWNDADNYYYEGNVIFQNGELVRTKTGLTNNIWSTDDSGILENATLLRNYMYYSTLTDGSNKIGSSGGPKNLDVRDNYFAGGHALDLVGVTATSISAFSGNTFYGAISGFTCNQYGTNTCYDLTRPAGVKIFVRPNKYEAGRANIAIFNWDLKSSVDVDVSGVLNPGDTYEVRNAQNFFGPPVRTGTYTGAPLNLPMVDLPVAPAIGNVPNQPRPTTPEFGAFVLLRTGTAPSAGVVYYVATNGNDANPGTLAAPFRTIQKAVNVVKAGDTVLIRGGRYAGFTINGLNGNATAPITFKAYPGERVIIDRYLTPSAQFGTISFLNSAKSSYLMFEDFEVTNSDPIIDQLRPLNLKNANDLNIWLSYFNNPTYSATLKRGDGFSFWRGTEPLHHNLVFRNLKIYHLEGSGFGGRGNDLQFLNNHVYDLGFPRSGYGWYISGNNNVIRGNVMYNNTQGIKLYDEGGEISVSNSIVENNFVYNNGGVFYHVSSGNVYDTGHGILLQTATDNIVRNNIVVGGRGSDSNGINLGPNSNNNKIFNNIIYGNKNKGISIGVFGNPTNTIIRNNIIWLNGEAIFDSGTGTILSNNLFTDPKFVNLAALDFHLQSNSPAIDAGTTLSEVTKDFDGVTRPQGSAYDIGAYEFTGAPPPPPIGPVYYVAKTGSDSYSCAQAQSEATPKLTINAALNCIGTAEGAGAGKTVMVKAGTYEEWVDNNLPGGTSWSAPFTLRSKPGDTVVMRPLASAWFVFNLRRATTKYAIIDGFIMDGINVKADVVVITDHSTLGTSHHIRIQNSEIKNAAYYDDPEPAIAQGQGLLIGPSGFPGYNEFINLDVHDNGADDFDHGFYITGSNNLVENSRIYRNAGWGVQVFSATSPHDTNNNIIRNNKIYDNARWGKRGAGIHLSSGIGNIAYNNLIWGNNGGISVGRGSVDAKIYSNTIWNNQGGDNTGSCIGISGAFSPVPQNTVIKNNICWQNKADINDGGSGTILSNNLFTDPKFVNPAMRDFHLQVGSPAIDAGITLTEVPRDFDSVTRPQGSAYDIGAYEFVP